MMTYATADLIDLHDAVLQSCETQFRSYGAIDRFHGPIRTLRCFEDNVLLRALLAEPGLGQVLVVDGAASMGRTLLGDAMVERARANGWAGLVLNAAVRDVAILRTLRLGVFALGSNPRRATKTGDGEIDQPVIFGGVTFTPGAYLYADEDGVILAPSALHEG